MVVVARAVVDGALVAEVEVLVDPELHPASASTATTPKASARRGRGADRDVVGTRVCVINRVFGTCGVGGSSDTG